MTKEEAIEIVKSAFSAWESEFRVPNDDWSEEHEALDMAIEALERVSFENDTEIRSCSKDSDLISRAETIEELDNYFEHIKIIDKRGLKRIEPISRDVKGIIDTLPSAEAEQTDCTNFVNWLTEEVMDEETWELNAAAYGEIICRKLVKLGVLEVTEEPSYYIRPSADTVEVVRCKDCKWYESGGLPCPLDLCESLGDDGFCSCGGRSE